MPDPPRTSRTGFSARSRWPLIAIVAGGVGVLIILAIYSFPYWFEESIRRGMEEHTRRQMAAVKAGTTTCISDPVPELIEELVNDRECADKIAEVRITGDFTRDISDSRFGALRRLPHLRTIRLEYLGCIDVLLENIQGLPSLEELSFHRAGVSRKGMRWVTGFPNLKRLSFDDRTDLDALDALKDHVGIESLGLYNYQATSERLAFLRTMPNLRVLSLELELQGGGVLDLRGLPKLEKISLGNSLATDAALESLGEMKSLTDLDLTGHEITDAGLTHLRNKPKLKRLRLLWQPITDAGLAQLTVLTGLEDLDLCKTRITDAGLEHLEGLAALKQLNLNLTRVTADGVKKLQQALPNCKITWDPPTPPAP